MSLMNDLQGLLEGDQLEQVSRSIGGNRNSTQNAMAAALPVLLGALGRNAQNNDGAEALAGALSRDHDGSVLDDLKGYLGNPRTEDGAGILRHTLGAKQTRVESQVSKASGLDPQQVATLLATLAPLVMGALGRQQRQKQLDSRGLGDMLSGEARNLESAGAGGGLLGALLDSDQDGDVDLGDLMRGAGKFFGR